MYIKAGGHDQVMSRGLDFILRVIRSDWLEWLEGIEGLDREIIYKCIYVSQKLALSISRK